MCVDITWIVMQRHREGRTLADIRREVDGTYAHLAPPTRTPYPPA